MKYLILFLVLLFNSLSFATPVCMKIESDIETNDIQSVLQNYSKDEVIEYCKKIKEYKDCFEQEYYLSQQILQGIIHSNDIDINKFISNTNVFEELVQNVRGRKISRFQNKNRGLLRAAGIYSKLEEANETETDKQLIENNKVIMENLRDSVERYKKGLIRAKIESSTYVKIFIKGLDELPLRAIPNGMSIEQFKSYKKDLYKIEKFKK